MEPFNLFKVKGVSKQEYWQCISYIAPTNEKKAWKAKDAIGTYCEVCEIKIPYHSVKNSSMSNPRENNTNKKKLWKRQLRYELG